MKVIMQTRNRVLSLPNCITSPQDIGCNGRSKSLSSLNCSNSSPSTVESASSVSIGGGATFNDDLAIVDFTLKTAQKCENRRPSSPSWCLIEKSIPPLSSYHSVGNDSTKSDYSSSLQHSTENKSLDDSADFIGVLQNSVTQQETDHVFRELQSSTVPCNEDIIQLSVIDEEKDDAESNAALETLDEENNFSLSKRSLEILKGDNDDDEEDQSMISFIQNSKCARPSAPALYHTRCQSMSSFDIPHSFSQPERLASGRRESSLEDDATMEKASSIKLPVRRGLSSCGFENENDAGPKHRPKQDFPLDKGTVLVALSSSSSSVTSKALDRSLSVSTPSIDSIASDHVKRSNRGKDIEGSRKGSKRTPSMVVPAIAPRIPLIGILPKSNSKSVERTGEGTKTKERSSGFFRQKRPKQSESRPHFWIKNSCSNSDCCVVCGKPLANMDAYQCNDCLSSVHSSCKASIDKTACVKMKHPKPVKAQSNAINMRSTVPENVAGQHAIKTGDSNHTAPVVQFSKRELMRNQRHSVVGMFPETPHLSYSLTAPARLGNNSQPPFRTYENGFRFYCEGDEPWIDLDLWKEYPDAWSTGPGKVEKKSLSAKEVKRQDNFHELFITELHHCQTLTVLKHTYFLGLLTNRVIPIERLNQLLPCLDELIEIHYEFFRLLKEKRNGSLVVERVHDVLLRQFTGDTGIRMTKAYTQFCSQKDATVREYNRLMNGGPSAEFAAFIKSATVGTFYKSRTLPDCLLLVTQRLSKYHSFVENLRKNTADETPEKEGILIAEKAVKELVTNVDSGIERAQMQQARTEICNLTDPKSAKENFKVDDLKDPERTLLYYGDVFWQNARQKAAEVTLLLFSDVIVFLQKNGNGGYNFFHQDGKSGIIVLHKLIVRDKAGRFGSQGIYLIATSPKPDMYDISCKSKKELNVWMDRIQRAVQSCSAKDVGTTKLNDSFLTGNEESELNQFFEKLNETNAYARCVHDARMKVYVEMFDYIAKLSLRNNEDKDKIVSLLKSCSMDGNKMERQENVAATWQAMEERFGNALATNDEEDTGLQDKEAPGTDIGRSKTFHFAAPNAGRKPKLRKHPTVSGIPEMEGAMGKRISLPTVVDDLSSFDAGSASEATVYLLNCWSEMAMQIEELKQDKLRLTAELSLAKERSRQTAGALAYDSGLENLRRLSSELETRKKQFYEQQSNKEIEMKHWEKTLKEKEEKLMKEEEEIRERWSILQTTWDNQRFHGVPLPPLVSSPSSSSNLVPDRIVESSVDFISDSTDVVVPVETQPLLPQRAASFRPADVTVPVHLAGAVTNSEFQSVAGIRQQLPTNLRKDLDSLSSRFRHSIASHSKEKSGKKKHLKSPDRQVIPNKLASLKK